VGHCGRLKAWPRHHRGRAPRNVVDLGEALARSVRDVTRGRATSPSIKAMAGPHASNQHEEERLTHPAGPSSLWRDDISGRADTEGR